MVYFHAVALALALLTLPAWPLAPWVVRGLAPGFEPEQAALTVLLVRIVLPATVFLGLAGWAQTVLNVHRHFLVRSAVGVPWNLSIIAGIFLAGALWDIRLAAWATLFGYSLQFLIQVPALRRQGLRYRPVFEPLHPGLKEMAVLAVPALAGVGAHQVNFVVDRILASGLAEGSISVLNYSLKVAQLVHGLLAVSLITVFFPSLAERGAAEDLAGLRDRLVRGLAALAFLVVPATAVLVVLREDLVRLLFQRGAFDVTDARMTAVAVLFFGLGLPFLCWWDLEARAFYALRETATPVKATLVVVAVNVVLNLILVRPMAHGGLALATSIAALVGCVLLLCALRRRLGGLGGGYLWRECGKVALAAGVMGAALWRAAPVLRGAVLGLTAARLGPLAPGGAAETLALALYLALAFLLAGGVYAAACRAFRVREMALVRELGLGVLGRLARAHRPTA
jgi:putative peptidoglycan lipid II flippase